MTSLAWQLEAAERTAEGAGAGDEWPPVGDYPVRRPILAHGRVRRVRHLPPGSEPTVRPGDVVTSSSPVARTLRRGRAAVVDVAAGLGTTSDRDGGFARYLMRTAGERVARDEPIAARKTLGGLQKRTVNSPVSGQIVHVSTETGVVYVAPDTVEALVRAHLAGVVVEAHEHAVVVEGEALAIAGGAGAGPPVSGRLVLAESVDELPDDASDAIVACGFPLTSEIVTALVDRHAAAIVATTIAGETFDRLGWDRVFWPVSGAGHDVIPPLTVVALSIGDTPPPGAWEALRSVEGRAASALGAEPGAAAEVLIALDGDALSGRDADETGGDAAAATDDVRLAPGTRVQVVAGRAEGLSGEVVALTPVPYRLRSEVSAGVADVAFPYGVRLRLAVVHLRTLGGV